MNLSDETDDLKEFRFLTDILESFDEVGEGRDAFPISDADKELLRQMSKGDSSKEEVERATKLAATNRVAIEYLATCLKDKAA